MDCHAAWMGEASALEDFLYEALVGSISGQHRQHMLETANGLTGVAKESLANPWCDRLGPHKCPVCPESRSRDGCCSAMALGVKGVGEGDSEGGEEDSQKGATHGQKQQVPRSLQWHATFDSPCHQGSEGGT